MKWFVPPLVVPIFLGLVCLAYILLGQGPPL